MTTPTIDLAVTTSAWGSYGQYLPEWAESIVVQTTLPAQAVIMDGGCVHLTALQAARNTLEGAGIPTRVINGPRTPMGAARNAAVQPTTTEWAMHLDADDLLLPHALTDIATLMPGADVVSIGALYRDGRERCFPRVTREQILARQHGAFSCAPFRRRLWQQRPWQLQNDWIDSVFWVGLAHLGARFAGTDRPGFLYRDHADSFSRRLSTLDRHRAMRQWTRACREWTFT